MRLILISLAPLMLFSSLSGAAPIYQPDPNQIRVEAAFASLNHQFENEQRLRGRITYSQKVRQADGSFVFYNPVFQKDGQTFAIEKSDMGLGSCHKLGFEFSDWLTSSFANSGPALFGEPMLSIALDGGVRGDYPAAAGDEKLTVIQCK